MKQKTPLKRKTRLKFETDEHRVERQAFRRIVFETYGDRCFFCGQGGVVDPAHVIPRRLLNKRQRYAAPEINGRPLCRQDHTLQESGELWFSDEIIDAALVALRELGTCMDPRLKKWMA